MKLNRPKMCIGETYDVYVNGKLIGDVGAYPNNQYLMGIGTKSDLIDQTRFDAWVAKYPSMGWVLSGKELPKQANRIAARWLKGTSKGFPTSLEEWQAYISTMAPNALLSKATAVNTQRFADTIKENGFSLSDHQKIVLMFVRRCVALDIRLPLGGAYNMIKMARVDPVAQKGATMSPAEVEKMILTEHPDTEDDIDQTLTEFESS